MSVIAHQTEKEWISANENSRQRMSQTQLRAQQSNMQPDLRMHIYEHIIRVLQYQKDVNQKLHICIKHDFVVSNHTITVNLHSGTTQWKILGSDSRSRGIANAVSMIRGSNVCNYSPTNKAP
ncbi:hypothetical protein TNCV_2928261, partial [Trichonephila clavipes]